MKENIFWLWLSRLNLDPTNLREVLKRLSPTDVWQMKEEKLKKIFTSKEISKILDAKYRKNLDKYMAANKYYPEDVLVETVQGTYFPHFYQGRKTAVLPLPRLLCMYPRLCCQLGKVGSM